MMIVGFIGMVSCAWPHLKDAVKGKPKLTGQWLRRITNFWSIGVVATVVLLVVIGFQIYRHYHQSVQKNNGDLAITVRTDIRFVGGYNVTLPALGPVPVPNKFDLHWLFLEHDFAQYLRPMIDTRVVANGKENKIESAIFLDFPGRSRFIGFYLPNDVDTYEVCKALPDATELLVAHFASGHKVAGYGTFDKSQTPFEDLASTGRVYVYYEGMLSLPEAGDLTKLFESRHLGLILRGDEWLRMSILSRQQSGPKGD